ncbi:MAG: sodium-dependent transporter [Muribaculaceae bacterium]|nr:sodium-dependent transporter [Muribaculaceae bacterium]
MRSQFVTKTGVIAATVGSAVGLGNIWRFPYEAGVHGGGAFLLLYILCVLVIGVPVMVAEFSIGRGTHKNALGAFMQLSPRSPFRVVAYMGIAASLMILSFYSVVAGWIMEYLYQSVANLFVGPSAGSYSDMFAEFVSNPWRPVFWTLIFLLLNYTVLRRGVVKGIERISNILMPFLAIILVVFCFNSLLLPAAREGVEFLLRPDFSKITPSVVIGAMGQAFFSLSLGLTCLLTYASYFSDKTNLAKSALITAILDLAVAVMAGMMIFPAVFSYGMTPEAGPKLVFETFPAIFSQMPGGNVWSVAFYTLLFFASITSTISMSEISISYFIEERGMTRNTATGMSTGIAVVFGVLCALSFGVLSDVRIFGVTIFNLFDYVSSNILLPLGGLLISVYVGWILDRKYLVGQISSQNEKPAYEPLLRFCIRYVAPVSIAVIFIYGLFGK